MKVRTGFVSNSSSSSFCVIGVEVGPESKVIEAMGFNMDFEDGKNQDNFPCYGVYVIPDKMLVMYDTSNYGEFGVLGLDAEDILCKMSIPEAKQHLIDYIKDTYNVDIKPRSVRFEYGRAGDG